ncbi:transglycosylase SLT domain-containing protein [Streptomyces sp. NPDC053048]|uniref:transglycosylase SLT domain-containing protein n=1 Tax=Streptomyces sp. NPDC053048 TaxID=3365694 RepID=UPI0037D0B62C
MGIGYIEIVPKVLQKDMAELRQRISSELEKIGLTAAREVNQAVKRGLAGLPREAASQAQKAKAAVEGEARDAAETIRELERFVTRQYGQESARRLAELRQFYARYKALQEGASDTTRRALRETVRQEERAALDRIATERQRVREAARLARQQTQDQEAEYRRQVAAQREAVRQQIAAIREQAAAQRAALQDDIAAQQRIITSLRDRMRDVQRSINATNTTTQNLFNRTGASLQKMGGWFERVGTSITETGNLLATKFLGPLATAGAALTAVGVKSADSLILGQLGLMGSGVSAKDSAAALTRIRQYGVDTPYSIEDMQTYMTRYIRSLFSHEPGSQSKDPEVRSRAGRKAANRAADIVMMIGDNAAKAGNLDPYMVQRAMYAIDMILDLERVPTRNLKQFTASAGIPVQELAQIMDYRDKVQTGPDGKERNYTAAAQILDIMAKAKTTGGLQGPDMIDALIKNWEGNKDVQGFAKKVTASTITGRLQQMKEGAQVGLGNLFAKTDPKTGKVQYTGLGQRIMGTPVTRKGKNGEDVTTYEGGYLNALEKVAKEYAPQIPKFLDVFFDATESFASEIKDIADFIRDHPVIRETVSAFVRFLAEWGPLIVVVGLLSKVIGKTIGVVGKSFAPVGAAARGAVRGAQGANGVRSQVSARNEARRDARAAGGSRQEIRAAGRDAYRQRRAERRDGDTRGPGRRLLDSFTGVDSNQRARQQELRELERQMRVARDEATRLRAEIRDVNRESLRQIAQALAGNGSGSVQGSANQAQSAVRSIQTQGIQPLNSADLDGIRQEVERFEKAARDAVGQLEQARTKTGILNSAQLDGVTNEVQTFKNAADDAGQKVTSINSRVGNLNGKTVNDVRASVDSLARSAREVADQVGTGTMSSSVSGRVANLNRRRLTDIIGEFDKLHSNSDDVFKKIGQGTGAGSLAGRIGLLNARSLKDITNWVKDLARALKDARDEGDGLDGALDRIGRRTPGGGGSSGKGRTRKARGGVIPGYQPWVDSVPALLTPGEAILRPEVTSALGEGTINTWNELAIRGRLSRHARGGVVGGGKLNLDDIKELVELQNIAPIGKAAFNVMGLASSSNPLGGPTQQGILGTGDGGSRFLGSAAAERFRQSYDWLTEDMWTALKRVPTLIGQVAGVLGGALAPTLREYFWDDVWRGSGNIVERGEKFLGDAFSLKTLGSVWKDLIGGVWESLGSIWDTGSSLITDPIGSVKGAIDDVFDITKGSYNNFIGMVETVKDFKESPKEYAGRVYGEFMSTAQESMPNTEGLFDFKKGSRANGKPETGIPIEGLPGGSGAGQWRLVAAQALELLGLPQSALGTVLYRIDLESGGNPTAVNLWDINARDGTPSVGLMQVIGPTFGAYAGPFRGVGPFMYGTSVNPLANIYAGLNYATNRYASRWQQVLAGTTGYASGTLSASPGLHLVGERGPELLHFKGGERVYNAQETEALLNGKRYEIHVHEARNEPTPQAVLRALQTAEALYTTL